MAKRFLLIFALGTTLAVLGAGTASSLSVGVGGVTVTTPNLPAPLPNPLPNTTVQTRRRWWRWHRRTAGRRRVEQWRLHLGRLHLEWVQLELGRVLHQRGKRSDRWRQVR